MSGALQRVVTHASDNSTELADRIVTAVGREVIGAEVATAAVALLVAVEGLFRSWAERGGDPFVLLLAGSEFLLAAAHDETPGVLE